MSLFVVSIGRSAVGFPGIVMGALAMMLGSCGGGSASAAPPAAPAEPSAHAITRGSGSQARVESRPLAELGGRVRPRERFFGHGDAEELAQRFPPVADFVDQEFDAGEPTRSRRLRALRSTRGHVVVVEPVAERLLEDQLAGPLAPIARASRCRSARGALGRSCWSCSRTTRPGRGG